ncbi:type VI secretion system Vgr family protein [Roseateles sp. UC29_93]|uniref:type VI secretion system Vgr family protein n=1 Tax=Roseateles sp. UC29_93 TaxID=3350177 RepID=UPI00366F4E68
MAAPFRLKTALDDDVLRVHACASREALSDLGETTLTLLSERKDIRASELLGKSATLTMALRDDAPRHLAGYVTRFAQTGFEGKHTVYQMTMRPWLWLLTRTADCRIFQEMTVPDIVKAVFDDHPVARHEFKLMRAYRPWTYCVQYRETDFNFVARLLENEGIYWYFTHDESGHTLVLTDAASAHDCAPDCETLPFYGGANNAPPELEYVDTWGHAGEPQARQGRHHRLRLRAALDLAGNAAGPRPRLRPVRRRGLRLPRRLRAGQRRRAVRRGPA